MADSNPAVVAKLLARLQSFNDTNIPQDNYPIDPRSSPTHYGGVWTPWLGDPDPAKCARPPPPPPKACIDNAGLPIHCHGDLDGVKLNDTIGATDCGLTGWVSGDGYVGPSMLVQLLVDKKAVGAPVVGSIHRQIALNHGFHLPFPCKLAQSGNHSFEASAKLNASSNFAYILGPVCSSCTAPPAFCHKAAC